MGEDTLPKTLPFTEKLRTVLEHFGYDDDEDHARRVLRLCDELGCTVEDLPARYAKNEREADRAAAEGFERLDRMAAMLEAGVTPMMPPDELNALRTVLPVIATMNARMEALEASTAPSETEDPS
jgi:hypothetical protein